MDSQKLAEHLKQQFLQGQGITTQLAGNYNPSIERFSGGVNTGTDIGVPQGTPISLPKGNWQIGDVYNQAKGKGYVGNSENSGYGNSVVARNLDNNESYRFSHLLQSMVQPNQKLSGGIVGYSGSTGNSTGPHVDIEVGGFKDILRNVSKPTKKSNYRSSKLNPQDILQRVKRKFGSNIIGVSNNEDRLKEAQKKYGGTIRRITI